MIPFALVTIAPVLAQVVPGVPAILAVVEASPGSVANAVAAFAGGFASNWLSHRKALRSHELACPARARASSGLEG